MLTGEKRTRNSTGRKGLIYYGLFFYETGARPHPLFQAFSPFLLIFLERKEVEVIWRLSQESAHTSSEMTLALVTGQDRTECSVWAECVPVCVHACIFRHVLTESALFINASHSASVFPCGWSFLHRYVDYAEHANETKKLSCVKWCLQV